VRRICDRVMVLDHGEEITVDDPASAILVFREKLLGGDKLDSDHVLSHGHRVTRTVRIEEVDVGWPHSDDRRSVAPGEPVTVAIRYEADEPTDDVAFAMEVRNVDDVPVYGCNSDVLGQPIDRIEGSGWVTFEIPALTLVDGTYLIDVGVHTHDIVTEYDFRREAGRITVVGGRGVVGVADLAAKVHEGRPG
jgi:ABC-2 type transport system ATP-binding protein